MSATAIVTPSNQHSRVASIRKVLIRDRDRIVELTHGMEPLARQKYLQTRDDAIAALNDLIEQYAFEQKMHDLYRGQVDDFTAHILELEEQLETQQAALSEFLSHPVDNKAIERLRAAVSIPAKGYELHVRTGATPMFAADDDDYPAKEPKEDA